MGLNRDKTVFVDSGKTLTKGKGNFQLYGSISKIGTCMRGNYNGNILLVLRHKSSDCLTPLHVKQVDLNRLW